MGIEQETLKGREITTTSQINRIKEVQWQKALDLIISSSTPKCPCGTNQM
jgi:hypothetical protein